MRRNLIFLLTLFFWTFFTSADSGNNSVLRDYETEITDHFFVPGYDAEMKRMNELLFRHRVFTELPTLWDMWLHRSVLWQDVERSPKQIQRLNTDTSLPHHLIGGRYLNTDELRKGTRRHLASRIIDDEGYVYTMQHRGQAHPGGWPFAVPSQAGGFCFSFSDSKVSPYNDVTKRMHDLSQWSGENLGEIRRDPERGLIIELKPGASLTSPVLNAPPLSIPFLRIDWWLITGDEQMIPELIFSPDENLLTDIFRKTFPVASRDPALSWNRQTYSAIKLYDQMPENSALRRFRIEFNNTEPAEICIQAVMSATDSRHTINHSAWLRGIWDYVSWTGDAGFLKEQIARIRKAMDFAIREFQVEKHGCIFTPWVGKTGKSAIQYDGFNKSIILGEGFGGNYWDIVSISAYDGVATAYLLDTLKIMMEIETYIQDHPESGIPAGLTPDYYSAIYNKVCTMSRERFWNEEPARFGTHRDIDGTLYDLGFVIQNLEAVYYGLADSKQAESIMSWIDGRRLIPTDTDTGRGIYYWKFGPRTTTKRNLTHYCSGWTSPENIAWGDQIQDGGGVFGFSYFDIMARLKVLGPDNAWKRLKEILVWYDEVCRAGGYAEYYKNRPGNLQGGSYGAGGLGFDDEFIETVLVPQVMLYGFAGFNPSLNGFALDPKLPEQWPSLTIRDIRFHGNIRLEMELSNDRVIIQCSSGPIPDHLTVEMPKGWSLKGGDGEMTKTPLRRGTIVFERIRR